MRKGFFIFFAALFLVAFTLPNNSSAAIADGTYDVSYQVNKPGSNSASMANDYFLKPAKLIVNNGKMTMQLTIKNSSWVTQFNPPGGAKVISSSADQRTVQFPVSNANLVTIAMKIDIDDIDYHHSYSVDFVFNSGGLPEAKVEEPKEPVKQEPAKTTPAPKETPTKSSGSNTSSNTPAPSTEKQNTDSSEQQATTEMTKTDDSTKSDEEIASETKQAEDTEAVENPETSDELPLMAVILFIIAAVVFIRTKKTKTI